ncbi:uncharacterized protein E5676_scaffold237G001540 [Cucumis melo var. makuwa]|uniref:Uncharacterized protein n=1 Tax=Cucumis melo var. makuwa TaxID=1194695 RepID=A0A5D3DAM3_CUCMM|nr:uncharacterized protein E6C27_scaffold36G002380 [Cucumis melo var. makuwa]TYK20564.1 uncharacterized protein E5676_scaffold237G001540 [Cucumis melo var. makuwa]
MVIDESSGNGSGDNNFYGVLDEVLDVQYPMERCVWLFKLEDVENEQMNVLEIVVEHRVDEYIEDDTMCWSDINLTMVERSVVRPIADDFIDNGDEQLSHQIGSSSDE